MTIIIPSTTAEIVADPQLLIDAIRERRIITQCRVYNSLDICEDVVVDEDQL
jgi:hypothetical protein